MASWTDIPEVLKDATRADELTDWLLELPIDQTTRRALGHLWQQHLSAQLGNANWLRIAQGGD